MEKLVLLCILSLFGVWAQNSFPSQPTYNGQPKLYKSFSLPYTPYSTFNPNFQLITTTNVSAPYQGYPSFSADLFNVGDGTFYAITNRGPFVSCGPSSEYLVYPSLDPTAIRFQLTFVEPTYTGNITVYNPESYYWLRVSDAAYSFDYANGLSTKVTYFTSSSCATSYQLPFAPGTYVGDGLDPGAFVVLKKAQAYLIGEGNLPSLVLTDSSGKFLQRYLPSYVPTTDSLSQSLITRNLPGVLGSIRQSRDIGGGNGFGGMAISQDELTGWAVMRRPLGSNLATSPTVNASIHRVIQLDLTDPLNLQVTGMFYYQTTPLSVWQQLDPLTGPQDIKVTAMARLNAPNNFLILERGRSNSLVYQVDFSQASNVINDPESLYIPVLMNEQRSSSGKPIPWTLPQKNLVLDLSKSGVNPAIAAEGLMILSPSVIALTADNGWQSTPFQIFTIQLGQVLPTLAPQTASNVVNYYTTGTNVQSAPTSEPTSAPTPEPTPQSGLPQIPHTFTMNFNLGGIVQN